MHISSFLGCGAPFQEQSRAREGEVSFSWLRREV